MAYDCNMETIAVRVRAYMYMYIHVYYIMYMKRHVYSTLAKLVVQEENPDPIHYTRMVQTRKQKMNRTPVCPALRTGMVGETSFVCLYVYCTCVIVLRLSLLLQMSRDRKGSKSVEVWMASTLEQQTMVYINTFSFLFVMM